METCKLRACARLPAQAGVFVCETVCLVWVGFLELGLTSGNHRLAELGEAKRVARDWQGQNSAGAEAPTFMWSGVWDLTFRVRLKPQGFCSKTLAWKAQLVACCQTSLRRSGSRAGELPALEDMVGVNWG